MASIFMVQSGSCVQLRSSLLPRTAPNALTSSLSIARATDLGAASLAEAGIQGRLSRAAFLRKAAYQTVRASSEFNHKGQLVKDSWRLLRKDAGTHAANFFLKIFEIAPTVKQMFSFMRDSDLPAEKNPSLKSHALVVFSMTCEAAVLLGDDPTLQALRPKLLEMGETHVVHKVLDEHFDVVKYALLETLKDALKDQWSPDMRAAWGDAYDAVTKVIKDEMHDIRRREKAVTV